MIRKIRSGAVPHSTGRVRAPSRRTAVAAAILLTLPWTVWLLVRLLGLESGFPWVPALAFTPYIALTAFLPLAIAAYLRRWRSLAVTAVVVVVFAALLVPRALTAPNAEEGHSGSRLVVLTANLLEGQGDLGVLADLVEREKVDVLALQEVTPEVAEAMADIGLTDALPHDIVDARPGVSGSAIYARHPVTDITPSEVPDTHTFARPSAEVTVPDAPPFEITNAHLVPPTASGSIAQWQQEMAALPEADRDGPLRIIAGDLNATLDHAALRELIGTGYLDAAAETGSGLELTWSSTSVFPGLTIDHVLADDRMAVETTSVHPVPGSDHRALLAKLTLPAT
ncbi:endonuclease/exonuclease/phosphatase family metal-dependent hydrolase [Lipingzhangella halophila]|uniref:Endonuclease/exonuclease/phosphatase family metal-dependent hydrolase n=1 Tax=Lipingzhangella halophila TaxID=1783352 RepID=A0A7W7RI74_9ACTN|nr:endonuclease/exonuclease/phosphatase family protein [Lipingzhangella halophila]MBB4932477.1 endonuclease/exonuclease/phosphatase family metal-dependent hydrolase [Lipingzhangella halophila]